MFVHFKNNIHQPKNAAQMLGCGGARQCSATHRKRTVVATEFPHVTKHSNSGSAAPFFQVVANLTGFYPRSMKKVRPQPLQIVFSLPYGSITDPEKLVCNSFVRHHQVIVAYECARAS